MAQLKVPSTITYVNGKMANWGYLNTSKDEILNPFWILYTGTNNKTPSGELLRIEKLLKQNNQAVEVVVADYLRKIWHHTLEDIRLGCSGKMMNDLTIRAGITVPDLSSDSARDDLRKAAALAGMPNNAILISYSEAVVSSMIRDLGDSRVWVIRNS